MALFEQFPYTNFHELNLDWLIAVCKELETAFPQGTIGIPKGGTGADNAADARTNLGIAGENIPIQTGSADSIKYITDQLASSLTALAGKLNYRIYDSVADFSLTPGAVSFGTLWTAMSIGDILIAPPTEMAAGTCPESSGTVLVIRNGGTSGSVRFYGNETYEMEFSANYPTGTWKQVFTHADVIPIENGGTGADNAADALVNLGIDFSGEVLSVAGVGANLAGDVPLTAADLDVKYTLLDDITDLGIPVGSNISAIWTVMADHSRILFPASQCGDAPNSNGMILIIKDSTNNLGVIRFLGKNATAGNYTMYLDNSNVPDGSWLVDIPPLWFYETVDVIDDLSIATGAYGIAAGGAGTAPVHSGYTPVLMNVFTDAATHSGTGGIYAVVGRARVTDAGAVDIRIYNGYTSAIKIKVSAKILYLRDDAMLSI